MIFKKSYTIYKLSTINQLTSMILWVNQRSTMSKIQKYGQKITKWRGGRHDAHVKRAEYVPPAPILPPADCGSIQNQNNYFYREINSQLKLIINCSTYNKIVERVCRDKIITDISSTKCTKNNAFTPLYKITGVRYNSGRRV